MINPHTAAAAQHSRIITALGSGLRALGDTGRSHPPKACKTCRNKVPAPKPQPLNPIFKVKAIKFGLLLFLISALFQSCAVFRRAEPPAKSEKQIWDEVRKECGVIHDFWGKCNITLETGYSVIPVTAEVVFREPDWLVVRTSGPMNIKLVEFALKGDKFQIYSPFTNEYVSGHLDSVDFSTAFKAPVPNIDIRTVWIRFFNPLPPDYKITNLGSYGGDYVLMYESEKVKHEIWVKSGKMRIERENIFNKDNELLGYYTFSNFKKRSGNIFPRKIEIGDIDGGSMLTLEFGIHKINEGVNESQLNLIVPPGTNRIYLGGF
ncbi:DUF4292 domain-containing protein [bacterium]|nr:DUF4292 domain-containing protein [bacterium]